ncbi:MAG: tetratricopeptide repeat protein [Clostridia bacterium]|nr:tetratricopeptide repeat protein [Clostridia bacterium]
MQSVTETVARLDALLDREDFEGAKALLYESLREYLAVGDTLSAIGIYNEIMGFERQYGTPEAALNAADAALALLEERQMAVSRPAAMIVLNAATVKNYAGRDAEARALYDRAEALFSKYYPAGAKEFAGLYNNRASVYLRPGEYPKAEYYYSRALQILQRQGDVCDTAVTYINLAGLYARWPGREKEAPGQAALAARVMEIPEAARSGYYYYTCRKLAAACRELGLAEPADHFTERADLYYAGH